MASRWVGCVGKSRSLLWPENHTPTYKPPVLWLHTSGSQDSNAEDCSALSMTIHATLLVRPPSFVSTNSLCAICTAAFSLSRGFRPRYSRALFGGNFLSSPQQQAGIPRFPCHLAVLKRLSILYNYGEIGVGRAGGELLSSSLCASSPTNTRHHPHNHPHSPT